MTGLPELGWMAGQTVKGQLLTRVIKRLGFVALVRVHRIRNVAVRKTKELEAIFGSCVGESEKLSEGFGCVL